MWLFGKKRKKYTKPPTDQFKESWILGNKKNTEMNDIDMCIDDEY